MTATTAIPPDVDAYLSRVRAALSDLPADERDDLLADVEASVVEAAAEGGAISARLGPPEDFAAELRAAAGLQTPAPAQPRPTVGEQLRRALDHSRTAAARATAAQLAPIWWVARAYVVVAALALWWGSEWSTLLPPIPLFGTAVTSLVVLVLAAVASIWLGFATRRGGANVGRAALLANMLIVLAAFPVLGHLLEPRGVAAAPPAEVVPPADGLAYYGVPIDNVYPYTRDGRLLHDVLLYDGSGQPLNLRPGSVDPNRRLLATVDGTPIFNSFPIRYFEPGTQKVERPDAAPPVEIPEIATPPLSKR